MYSTPRLGLNVPEETDNESDFPAVSQQQMDVLDNASIFQGVGPLVDRPDPTAVPPGSWYLADDSWTLTISDGAEWNLVPISSESPPLGTIQAYAGDGDVTYSDGSPAWLTCDGRAIHRHKYAGLYYVIGENFGSGDGATTFNIPNLQATFPIGAHPWVPLGSSGGEFNHRHDVPAHAHGFENAGIGWQGDHAHWLSPYDNYVFASPSWGVAKLANGNYAWAPIIGYGNDPTGGGPEDTPAYTRNAGAHTHTLDGYVGDGAFDGDASFPTDENNPPYLALNYLIRAG